jgi:hypothetical protein
MPLNACKMRSMAEPVRSRIKSWKVVLTNMPAKCRHVAFGGIGINLPGRGKLCSAGNTGISSSTLALAGLLKILTILLIRMRGISENTR